MKNHTDVLIVLLPEQVREQICAGASQILFVWRNILNKVCKRLVSPCCIRDLESGIRQI